MPAPKPLHLAIVGPCGAGKSTLAAALRARGYAVREIVQEHSFVPGLWRHFRRPDVLIYLDAGYETCTRRKRLDWLPHEHDEQRRRLAHARRHYDVYVDTDPLTPDQVLRRVLKALGQPEV